MVLTSILIGGLIQRIGYYTPFMIVGACLTSVGAGLLYTLKVDASRAIWIGYQIPYGFGMGCMAQAPNLAAQTVLPRIDVPMGTSLIMFSQLLGGAVFISVGQNIVENQLVRRLSSVPGFSADDIEHKGATSLTNLPASIKSTVIGAYNESLRHAFLVGLVLACLSIFGALSMEWRSVKKNAKGNDAQPKESEEDGVAKAEEGEADTAPIETKRKELGNEKETTG